MTEQVLICGELSVVVQANGLGAVRLGEVEVLRGLTHPVRNADWGTYLTAVLSEEWNGRVFLRRFSELGGVFHGLLRLTLDTSVLEAELELTFPDGAEVNRAGFTLLHPIRDVTGEALALVHPDRSESLSRFPALISPSQPARNIAGLKHQVRGVAVDIAMEGDVFEMEDQRNWSDASFKTYCRPLSLPYPYRIGPGDVVRQKVTIRLAASRMGALSLARPTRSTVRMPEVLMAHEAGLSSVDRLEAFAGMPVLFRLDRHTPDRDLQVVAGRRTAMEIVFDDRSDLLDQIARAQGMCPLRVTALPRAFLKSYQPGSTWPDGMQPADALPHLRAAFPDALIGGGSLTNFTELNRCRPCPRDVDFVTFGNTAIVHAADDLSVWQTIEALDDIVASANSIAEGRPLHLGLMSIGMRSNPYGSQVAPNPQRLRLPMAQDDPRQAEGFAAAYAVAVLSAAARGGVASLALAMPDGPLGAAGPLGDVIRLAHAMAGHNGEVTEDEGRILIRSGNLALAANCTVQVWTAPGLGSVAPEHVICSGNWKE